MVDQSEIAVFITASSNLEKTKRAYETARLSFDNVLININTLNDHYRKDAIAYCLDNDIIHIATKSNGYPAKGKNATFDWFKEFDFEWMVALDGDDYFGPHAFDVFSALIHHHLPDIGILLSGTTVRWEEGGQKDFELYVREKMYNSYNQNNKMSVKLTTASNVMRASRPVLYNRSVIWSDEARMNEKLKGLEDFHAVLRFTHLRNKEDLNLVSFTCDFDSYIYDVSEEGDHLTAMYQKPEEFSKNMVEFWNSLQGLNIQNARDHITCYRLII